MSDASNDPDPVEMKVDPSVTDSLKNPGDTNSFGSPNSEEDAPVTADLISNAEPNRVEQSTASKPQLQFGSPDHQGLGGTNQDTHRWWSPVVMVFISLAAFLIMSGAMAVVALLIVKGVSGLELLQDPKLLGSAMEDVLVSRLGLFLSLVIPQAALVLPCLIAAKLSPIPFKQRLGLVRGNWPIGSWLAVGAASPLVGIISGLILSRFVEESPALKEMNHVFREHGTNGFFIPLALMIGLTPAFCEELLFRGYIQQRLTLAFRPKWGIFVASFLFAAFHIDPVHAIAVFPLGLFLGWITWRSGSLIPAMIGHFVNNFVSVIGIVVTPEDQQDTLGLPAAALSLSVFGFGLVGVAVIARIAYQSRNTVPAEVPPAGDATGQYPSGESSDAQYRS